MERRQILGMVCGYFLSRFDQIAYASLGYRTQQATHDALGQALGVAPESIKNWRDEFDPVHDNPRRGWHGREMHPSRRRTIEALGDLGYDELLWLVHTITSDPAGNTADVLDSAIGDEDSCDANRGGGYGLRGPTGVLAEKAFEQHHAKHGEPSSGRLVDRRHEQCGYDYEIIGDSVSVYVEVKGLGGDAGGITFTDKEWRTLKTHGDKYFLVVVRRVGVQPVVSMIRDPFSHMKAQMRTYTTVQTAWSVNEAVLRAAEKDAAS
jgi:hypothetical protein